MDKSPRTDISLEKIHYWLISTLRKCSTPLGKRKLKQLWNSTPIRMFELENVTTANVGEDANSLDESPITVNMSQSWALSTEVWKFL